MEIALVVWVLRAPPYGGFAAYPLALSSSACSLAVEGVRASALPIYARIVPRCQLLRALVPAALRPTRCPCQVSSLSQCEDLGIGARLFAVTGVWCQGAFCLVLRLFSHHLSPCLKSPNPSPNSLPISHYDQAIGPICNLDCEYCFYLEKEQMYDKSGSAGKSQWAMSQEVLETYIRDYIASQPTQEITFAWQGGEPTLLGLDYFKRAVELQQWYLPAGKKYTTHSRPMALYSTMIGAHFLRKMISSSASPLMAPGNYTIDIVLIRGARAPSIKWSKPPNYSKNIRLSLIP